jgi:hypothetical protein
VAILIGRYPPELSGDEDGVQGQGRSEGFLRGMSTGVPRIVSNKCMEAIFRHGDVACAVECLITTLKPSQDPQHYHVDIQELLGKHDKVFRPLLLGDRLTGDLSMSLS